MKHFLDRESQPKPSFVTIASWEGGRSNFLVYLYSTQIPTADGMIWLVTLGVMEIRPIILQLLSTNLLWKTPPFQPPADQVLPRLDSLRSGWRSQHILGILPGWKSSTLVGWGGTVTGPRNEEGAPGTWIHTPGRCLYFHGTSSSRFKGQLIGCTPNVRVPMLLIVLGILGDHKL